MITARLPALSAVGLLSIAPLAHASLTPELQRTIRAATFEVVMRKPTLDPVSYEKPLPLDLLPYHERNDAYESVGTAFALGDNTYVTAAHVVEEAAGSQWGPPELRRSDGSVFEIDHILKFSAHEDFVVFSLKHDPQPSGLSIDRNAKLDDPVLAVGNALGEGIVIRDGLLTSETPEDQDGRWKWIRFSAAASPGNSGGPLCDANGGVIGIVIGKSPNENLNYSLPIARVLDAEPSKARFDFRWLKTVPFLHGTITHTYRDEFRLPLTWAEFSAAYRKTIDRHDDESRDHLLETYADTLFPKGPGVDDLIFDSASRTEPRLILQGADGAWYAPDPDYDEVRLTADGTVSAASTAGVRLLRLVRSDRASDDAFYQDSKAFMDLALRALDIRRVVGPDHVRVTSLGRAMQDSLFTDPYGRRWQQRVWAVPYMDSYLVGMLLPTPDGYDAIIKTVHSTALHSDMETLRLLAGLTDVSYSGTFAQWQAALRRPSLLPKALEPVRLERSAMWTLHTPRFDSNVPSAVLPLTDKSRLTLTMGFIRAGSTVSWDIQQVWWEQDERAESAVILRRWAQPSPGAKLELRNRFADVRARHTPYDGTPIRDSETSFSSTAVLDVPGKAAGTVSADVAYDLTVRLSGMNGLMQSSSSIDNVVAATKILERGDGAETAAAPTTKPVVDDLVEALERDALAEGFILDSQVGKDVRGRLPSQDIHDFIAAMSRDFTTVSSVPADDRRRLLEQQRQRLSWLKAYWSEYPAVTHNRDMWASFLEKNGLPASTPHQQAVTEAESRLQSSLSGPISGEWAERARLLRNAYIEERRYVLKSSLRDTALQYRSRTTQCPPPATTISSKSTPQVGHALHSLEELWPPESKRLGEEGIVFASMRISAAGCVTALAIAGSSGSDLMDNAVRDYLESMTFVPGAVDGKAIETTAMIPIAFKLSDK